jgi:hypothetical protein
MKRPYLVVFANGGRIVGDFAFLHKDGGACFVEIFYDIPGRHPFHILDGPVNVTDDLWTCGGGVKIRSLSQADPEWWGWMEWMEYKNHEDGRHATDDVAIAACKRDGAIIPEELVDQVKTKRKQKKLAPIEKQKPFAAEKLTQENKIKTCEVCGNEFDLEAEEGMENDIFGARCWPCLHAANEKR